jgi:hypothetical protein
MLESFNMCCSTTIISAILPTSAMDLSSYIGHAQLWRQGFDTRIAWIGRRANTYWEAGWCCGISWGRLLR